MRGILVRVYLFTSFSIEKIVPSTRYRHESIKASWRRLGHRLLSRKCKVGALNQEPNPEILLHSVCWQSSGDAHCPRQRILQVTPICRGEPGWLVSLPKPSRVCQRTNSAWPMDMGLEIICSTAKQPVSRVTSPRCSQSHKCRLTFQGYLYPPECKLLTEQIVDILPTVPAKTKTLAS